MITFSLQMRESAQAKNRKGSALNRENK